MSAQQRTNTQKWSCSHPKHFTVFKAWAHPRILPTNSFIVCYSTSSTGAGCCLFSSLLQPKMLAHSNCGHAFFVNIVLVLRQVLPVLNSSLGVSSVSSSKLMALSLGALTPRGDSWVAPFFLGRGGGGPRCRFWGTAITALDFLETTFVATFGLPK